MWYFLVLHFPLSLIKPGIQPPFLSIRAHNSPDLRLFSACCQPRGFFGFFWLFFGHFGHVFRAFCVADAVARPFAPFHGVGRIDTRGEEEKEGRRAKVIARIEGLRIGWKPAPVLALRLFCVLVL